MNQALGRGKKLATYCFHEFKFLSLLNLLQLENVF